MRDMGTEVERQEPALEGKVVTTCGAVEASCRCSRRPHQDGRHECDCGGSWEWRGREFVIHAIPRCCYLGSGILAGTGFFSGLFAAAEHMVRSSPRAIQPKEARPEGCHRTNSGIMVHVKPGCRCPRRRNR
jgi:hypothetical protein